MSSTRRRKARSRRRGGNAAGQAAVELALVLPLLTIFTVVIVQFSVVARDQLALWQSAREITRDVALAIDPDSQAARLRADDTEIILADGAVTVAVTRRTRLTLAGFDFLRRTVTLSARVSMALEPPVAFSSNVVGDEFPAPEP
ncbi:MAG: TadE family protein [Actinomycetota bacterium]